MCKHMYVLDIFSLWNFEEHDKRYLDFFRATHVKLELTIKL